ncbi:MAG: glycosyltransferase family 2 protein [Actinomycetes bacterium]
MTRPWLHVLIPAYGASPYLAETLSSWKSELAVGNDLLAVTVVDDGSPSGDIEELVKACEGVSYIRNPVNLGVAANFAHCAELSQGEYTVICGSDDLALPGYVNAMRKLLRQFPESVFAMPGVAVIDEAGMLTRPLVDRVKGWLGPRKLGPQVLSGERLATSLLLGNWLYFPAITWQTKALREFGFRIDQTTAMDLDLELRMIFSGGTVAYEPVRMFAYRRHSASISATEASNGARFREEAAVSSWARRQALELGWRRAAFAAAIRPTSRAHRLLRVVPTLKKTGSP